jgi:alpha-galactosidase
MRLIRALAVLVLGAALVPLSHLGATAAHAESNGLASTPLMGWSSWSYIRSAPTEAKIEAQADALKSSGLTSYGYDYVNLDDFYYVCDSGTGPAVNGNGYWQVDSAKFPDGIAAVASHVHADGEKFGLYVTPGISKAAVAAKSPIQGTSYTADQIATSSSEANYNCGGMVGINYSAAGAQAFINGWADEMASWGVDYVKLDGVGSGDIPDVQAWSTALRQTGRPMALELSNSLPIGYATTWESLANGWRTTGDIECYGCESGGSYPLTDYSNVASRFDAAANWQPYGQVGGWNDYDSIEVGNGSNDGLTVAERQTQLSLWAMADSPLMLGTDLTHLDATDKGLLENSAVIAVDQDTIPAARVINSGSEQVFSKRETDGSYYVAVFNTDSGASHAFRVSLPALGLTGSATATNLWTGASLGTVSGTFTTTVAAGGVTLIHAVPSGNGGATELIGTQSGKCLDITGGEVFIPGTAAEIWTCRGGLGQAFTLTSGGQLRTEGSTECLDVYNNGTAPGTKVELWPCNGQTNQQWTLESNGTIVGTQSGLCLDVKGQGTADGTAVDIWTCNGQTNQQWTRG